MQPTTRENTPNNVSYPINLNNEEFREAVQHIVDTYEIEEIVETGTFNGMGSTRVFAKTGKYVFTIECNKNNYEAAIKNLSSYDNVCVIHGLSLDRKYIIQGLLNEKFDIDTKYDSDFPKSFYMREISQQVVVENCLDTFTNNDRKQLIFLDSAGGMGMLEFEFIMSLKPEYLENKILMLDDISHIKHKRSVELLEKNSYNLNISSEKRFAWCEMSKNGKNILSKQLTESR